MLRAQQLVRHVARKRCRAGLTSATTHRCFSAYTQESAARSSEEEPSGDFLHGDDQQNVQKQISDSAEEIVPRSLFHTLRAYSIVMPSQLAGASSGGADGQPAATQLHLQAVESALHSGDSTEPRDEWLEGDSGKHEEFPSLMHGLSSLDHDHDDATSPGPAPIHTHDNNAQPTIDSNLLNPPDQSLLGGSVTAAAATDMRVTNDKTKAELKREAEAIRLLESLERRLFNAVTSKNVDVAINLFEAAIAMNCKVPIRLDLVKELYFFMAKSKPFHTYQILQYYKYRVRNLEESKVDHVRNKLHNINYEYITHPNMMQSIYHRMCDSLRYLDPEFSRHHDIKSLVQAVIAEVEQQDEAVQNKCIPMLVSALAAQKTAVVGPWAAKFYQHMLYSPQAKNFEEYMTPSYFMHLLAHSKFNRPEDLPYHDVLRRVVEAGRRPFPHVVLNALENLFPYSENVEATYIALKAVFQLQQKSLELFAAAQSQQQQQQQQQQLSSNVTTGKEDETIHSYVVDISTLEYIAAAAARTGCCDLNFLLWDVLEVMGLEPTESIYESTIICFAQNPQHAENAFAVLWDMEEKGFTASLPLIRQFGTALRDDRGTMQTVEHMLEAFQLGTGEFSPASLNVLMSAYAEKGEVEKTLALLDEFERMDWTPTADSFSFALEAVGKAAGRMANNKNLRITPQRRESNIASWMQAADNILTLFENTQVENPSVNATSHVIRNYVEFLCHVNHVETATQLVVDLLTRGERSTVDNKTLFRVAVANAQIGNFDVARSLADETTEPMPFITQKIDQIYDNKVFERSLQQHGGDDDPAYS